MTSKGEMFGRFGRECVMPRDKYSEWNIWYEATYRAIVQTDYGWLHAKANWIMSWTAKWSNTTMNAQWLYFMKNGVFPIFIHTFIILSISPLTLWWYWILQSIGRIHIVTGIWWSHTCRNIWYCLPTLIGLGTTHNFNNIPPHPQYLAKFGCHFQSLTKYGHPIKFDEKKIV